MPAPPFPNLLAVQAQSAQNVALATFNVNHPIIFEAVPGLSNRPQIWLCVSSLGMTNGGCVVWLSTDGGNNYNSIGSINNNQVMGVVFDSDYPSNPDPDTVDTLNVDLTESKLTLSSFTPAQRDAFISVCYLAGGPWSIPYELIAYGDANLVGNNQYALPPTIRRGVYGTPIATHTIGSTFSYLGDGNVFKIDLQPALIGTTLFFKLTAFNIFGQNVQSLSDVDPYQFTPTGEVGWANSSVTGTYWSTTPLPTKLPFNSWPQQPQPTYRRRNPSTLQRDVVTPVKFT